MKKQLLYALCFFAVSAGLIFSCEKDPQTLAVNTTALVGNWKLDDVTADWLDRACVQLDFPENDQATFEIIQLNEEELVLRFNNEAHTSWRGKIHRRVFDATQILPTTSVGRLACGDNTAVRVLLRFNSENPDQIEGTWQTPQCSYCPDRVFDAIRVVNE